MDIDFKQHLTTKRNFNGYNNSGLKIYRARKDAVFVKFVINPITEEHLKNKVTYTKISMSKIYTFKKNTAIYENYKKVDNEFSKPKIQVEKEKKPKNYFNNKSHSIILYMPHDI